MRRETSSETVRINTDNQLVYYTDMWDSVRRKNKETILMRLRYISSTKVFEYLLLLLLTNTKKCAGGNLSHNKLNPNTFVMALLANKDPAEISNQTLC